MWAMPCWGFFFLRVAQRIYHTGLPADLFFEGVHRSSARRVQREEYVRRAAKARDTTKTTEKPTNRKRREDSEKKTRKIGNMAPAAIAFIRHH